MIAPLKWWEISNISEQPYLHTYLLTYTTEQSPAWEVNRFSASQEIPRILWNPHSQVPTTYPYPEPAWSSPYSHIPLPEDPA
jgi:hypothetical protein